MALAEGIAEADRQLGEQRSQADAFASRAGVMMAATSLMTAFVAASSPRTVVGLTQVGVWFIVASAILGVIVLCMGRLSTGPVPSELSRLDTSSADTLFAAKLIIIQANTRTLIRTELMFFLQAVGSVAGLSLVAGGVLL